MKSDCANLPGMIGRHPSMLEVYRLVRRVAPTTLPVAIVGETGTGKELVARALHTLGVGDSRPFVDVNCAAIPESLAEAELFGWERGAFTGAVGSRVGLLEQANGGTLFLDEACSLPLRLQATLLRAIEGHGFRRVGGRSCQFATFRLVTAVARPVCELSAMGLWREDFLYRVARVAVTLPPLRARGSDVALLARHFLACRMRPEPLDITSEALELMYCYRWPGNVRELAGAMETVTLMNGRRVVDVDAIVSLLRFPVKETREMKAALEAHDWNVSATARALGVSVATHKRRIAAARLRRPGRSAERLAEPARAAHEPVAHRG